MQTYVLCLTNLYRQPAFVIGGGEVAARKAAGLLDAGAPVIVISPEIRPEIEALAAAGRIEILRQAYRRGLLAEHGAGPRTIVIAATDDRRANETVWEEGDALGCLVNVVDDPGHSHFILPAVLRRGEVQVAISTGGTSPALARRLRERLEEVIEPEYAGAADLLAVLRPELMRLFPPGTARRDAALRLIDSGLLEKVGDDPQMALTWARAFLHSLAEGGAEE